ncbi:hypothetical protein X474_00105 [Dethiosulfatarculus sandiegensis]|uniref:Uncharacterized protein n=1 Tax=Dethiosulfatarculus sandiegensis TaxID=1429043 RepID=A0A0D2GN26_9BACT|nr:hypothetical protein X474_00105 [Dethiosulfatarculus sandiegensis]
MSQASRVAAYPLLILNFPFDLRREKEADAICKRYIIFYR